MKISVVALMILALQTVALPQAAPRLSLTLERIHGQGAAGREVHVRVRVTNISQQAVDLLFPFVPEMQYTFAVVGPDGRPAPPTKDVEERRRIAGSQRFATLAPGQTDSSGWCPLSDLVDFSRPGTYRITATRHFGEGLDETDTSNVLEVKIP
jgi:hypothetical protein